MAEVDSLEIKIEAASTDAAKKVNDLASALERVKGALAGSGLGNVSQKLQAIGNAGQQIKLTVDPESGKAVDALTAKVNALRNAVEQVNSTAIKLPNVSGAGGSGGGRRPSQTPPVVPPASDAGETSDLDSSEVTAVSGKLAILKAAADAAKNALSGLGGTLKSAVETGASLAANAAKSLSYALLDVGKRAGRFAVTQLKSVGKALTNEFIGPVKNAVKALDVWKRKIGSVMFYRAIRTAIKAVTDGFKTGIENLYQYSRLVGTQFAPAMDSLATSALYLKNSLGAMAAPLIQALAPAVDMLVDKLVQLMNVAGKAFAALTGKKTYSQAVKVPKEYAEEAEKAAKATKNWLLGIDELNIMTDDSKSGSKEAEDYGSMFEEVEVPLETWDWAEQVRKAIEDDDWQGAGSIFAEKLNDVIDSWDAFSWAQNLGKKINDALEAIYGFMTTFDFEGLGKKVAEGLNGLMDEVDWDLLGRVFASKWNALVDFIYGFVTTFHWADLGKNISDAVNAWFDEINWGKAGLTISLALEGLLLSIRTFLQNTDWSAIGDDIATLLNNIRWEELFVSLGGTIADAINAAAELAIAFFETFDFARFGSGLANGIKTAVENVDMASVGQAISDAMVGALDFAIAFLETIDYSTFPGTVLTKIGEAIENIDVAGIAARFVLLVSSIFVPNPADILDIVGGLSSLLGSAFESIGLDAIAGFFKGIGDALMNAADWLKQNLVDPVVNAVKDLFGIHSPSTVFAEIGENIVAGLTAGISETWQSLVSSVTEKVDSLIKSASSWGADIASNIASGISGAIGKVKSAASSLAGKIKEYIHFSEPDTGPLSDFHTYMPDMMSEMAKGIRGNGYMVTNAVSEMAGSMYEKYREIALDMPEVRLASHSDMSMNYAVAYSGSGGSMDENGRTSMSPEDIAKSNYDVVNAVMAIGSMIVKAINDKDSNFYVDGLQMSRQLDAYSEQVSRENGSSLIR